MASKLLCCLDADQGAREWGKAGKNLKCACYFKHLEWGKRKPRGLIPTLLFDLQRIEQCIPAIEIESRFLNPQTHPEALASQSPKESGEGRIELKTQFQTQPPCAHLMCTSLIPYQRGVWLWSCFSVWTQIKEKKSSERQTKILNCTCYFEILEWGEWKPRGLIPTLLFDLQRIEQCIPAIKLESRFLNPQTHPEATSSQLPKGLGKGRIELKTQFQTQPPCAHLMCTSLVAYWRGVWLQSCFVLASKNNSSWRGE